MLLVGWSYGAAIALHWGTRNPDRIAGAVSVDGAYSYDAFASGDISPESIRKLFRKLRPLLPIASLFGNAARMSAAQHAEINIEINQILAAGAPILERVSFPFLFVVATGKHLGAPEGPMARVRASLEPLLARNPNLRVSARVTSNHETIIRKDYPAIVDAVRKTASIHQQRVG